MSLKPMVDILTLGDSGDSDDMTLYIDDRTLTDSVNSVRYRLSMRDTTGLLDGAPSSLETADRQFSDGAYANDAYAGARTITLSGYIMAPCDKLLPAWNDLKNFLGNNTEHYLQFSYRGLARHCTVIRSRTQPQVKDITPNILTYVISLIDMDGYLYGDSIKSTTGLPTSVGGLTFPLAFGNSAVHDIIFDDHSVSGDIILDNDGASTPLRITVTGGLDGFTITSAGREINYPGSLSEASRLVIDSSTQQVMLNGEEILPVEFTNLPWLYAPNGESSYAFRTEKATTGTPLVTIEMDKRYE